MTSLGGDVEVTPIEACVPLTCKTANLLGVHSAVL
jgi:hypothetical protein